ncbi:hypothetical protein BHE97_06585 [Aeromicrobium sp. PE09-221]|nr:hypothetical protein BHE97_06585 [Aeromicrobium sp. PE09-221]
MISGTRRIPNIATQTNFCEFQKKRMTNRLTQPGPLDSTITAQNLDAWKYPIASMNPRGIAQVLPCGERSQATAMLVGAVFRRYRWNAALTRSDKVIMSELVRCV